MSHFKAGNVVRLNGGSPNLTVTYVTSYPDGTNLIHLSWIAYSSGILYTATAKDNCLTLVKE